MIWIGVALITLVTIAILAWPALRGPKLVANRAAYDLTVFQDQLKELDRDIARGVLTPQEADAARLEIQRRILASGRAPTETVTAGTGRSRWVAVGISAVVVPLIAVGAYLTVGTPDPEKAQATAMLESEGGMSESDIDALVDRLAARVASEPENPEGFALLARTYRELGRFPEAAETYRKLTQLQPSAENFSSLGESLAALKNGQVDEDAHNALMSALAIDRDDPRARFYLGLEQAANGNARDAIAIWRDLTASAAPDASWVPMVREQMSAIAQNFNIAPMTVEPRHPLDLLPANAQAQAAAQAAAKAAPAAAPAAEVPAGMDATSPENIPMIQGMVAGLAAKLEQNPEDFNGWMMLGRSYTVLKQPELSAEAFKKASALRPKDVAPRLQQAAALMGTVDPNAATAFPAALTAVVNEILKLEPQHPEGLYLAGLGRAKVGDSAGARAFWQRGQKVAPEGTPLRTEMDRRLGLLK